MVTLFMSSYAVERNFHPTDHGYQYAASFKIDFAGAAYTTVVLTVLWNQKKTLVPGTTRTEAVVTGATVTISKSGSGWAVVADIAGDEPWVGFKNTVIRFRKSFTVELPIAPSLSKVPVLGEMAKDLGATTTTRIQADGVFDVVSYVESMQTTVY